MILAIILLGVLVSCTQGIDIDDNTSVTNIENQSDMPDQSLRESHPEWYYCESDADCVTAPGECGSTCASESLNSKHYSDYVVAFSMQCQGTERIIKQCPYSQKSCMDGVCTVRIAE